MYFFICFLLIFLDQIIKLLCIKMLMPINSLPIIKNFFYLTYVENRGAAFGIFEGGRVFFIIITIAVLITCFYFFNKPPKTLVKPFKFSLIFIISGAIGNLIDRLFRGFVIDMFHFVFWGKDFAVFNVADILIVIGTISLFLILTYSDIIKNKGK